MTEVEQFCALQPKFILGHRPDFAVQKIATREKMQEQADNDFVAIFNLISDYEDRKSVPWGDCCCFKPPHIFIANEIPRQEAVSFLETNLAGPPVWVDMGIPCICGGTRALMHNILKIREENRCEIPLWAMMLMVFICPCAAPILVCCRLPEVKPYELDLKVKLASLIASYKQVDVQIKDAKDSECFCYAPITIDTNMTAEITKLTLLAEVDYVMKRMIQSDHLIRDDDTIEGWNKIYKQRVINSAEMHAKISERLISFYRGTNDGNSFKTIKGGDFTSNYILEHAIAEKLLEERIRANHKGLVGDNPITVVPANLRFIVNDIFDQMDVAEWSCRIKEVDSAKEHVGEKVFDFFGMKFVSVEKSQFLTLAKALMLSRHFIKNRKIQSIKIKYATKESSYLDFKMIIVLDTPTAPIVEIQIVPVQNFISDSMVKGHEDYKAKERAKLEASSSKATLPHMSMERL